jgi:hypothetical protein
MESKLKTQCMDSVGELPAGYLHLPITPIKKEPQLTDWISGDLKPVMDGVYQRNYRGGIHLFFCAFKNGNWYLPTSSINDAWNCVPEYSTLILPWRGLSSNPNEVQ